MVKGVSNECADWFGFEKNSNLGNRLLSNFNPDLVNKLCHCNNG